MSRQDSVGDLVPRDVAEVLARENRANKGKKKHGGSFSRAFSWLKGTKKKRSAGDRQACGGRPGDSRPGRQGLQEHHGSEKAASKQEDERKLTVHYRATPHYPENVFIEGGRPQYLEDLHTEAQEGLKSLQQEEKKNCLDYQDGQSVSSTQTLPAGDEASVGDGTGSPESGSGSGDPGSAPSTRPTLMRHGSTFRPLNPVKRLEKTRKRNRRTTIMGIPHHVQKELGLERGALCRQDVNGRLPNRAEGAPDIVVIPTIDGEAPVPNHEGARVHLQNIEARQSSSEERLLKHHLHAVYGDDMLLGHRLGTRQSPAPRPKSLAVPGMTTSSFTQEPPGPVMSISPQATYLSKIIPNAILPAAVDVIEISRSRSRSSVRTVSKSSLVSASPASSRSGTPHGASSCSHWSHSQSSETVVSNSSTISSRSSGKPRVPNGNERGGDRAGLDQVSMNSSASWASSCSAGAKQRLESGSLGARDGDDGESQQNDRSFMRSLSIVKTKMPPAPPRRTYSLHQNKLKRRSRELEDKDFGDSADGGGELSWTKRGEHSNTSEEAISPNVSCSAGSPVSSMDSRFSAASSLLTPDQSNTVDNMLAEQSGSSDSSPQKSSSLGSRLERTMSPSSGYSSQSGTPTLSAKDIYPPSPGKKKVKPVKPERSSSRLSPAASISSSLTSLSSAVSEPIHREALANGLPSHLTKASPHVAVASSKVTPTSATKTLREAFEIPPPPKVQAPTLPPPETWMHNKRPFELLCGPNVLASRHCPLQRPQPKASPRVQSRDVGLAGSQTAVENETIKKKGSPLPNHKEVCPGQRPGQATECAKVFSAVKVEECRLIQTNDQESLVIQKKEWESSVDQKLEQINQRQDQESFEVEKQKLAGRKEKQDSPVMPKKEPAVMEKCKQMGLNKVHKNGQESMVVQSNELPLEVKACSSPKDDTTTTQKEVQCNIPILERTDAPQLPEQTPSSDDPKPPRISPPPSPPPAYHPPPPPSKKSQNIVAPIPAVEDPQLTFSVESSWPPPPPPMEESLGPVLEGQEEPEFPLPPPPVLQEFVAGSIMAGFQGTSLIAEDLQTEKPEELTPSVIALEAIEGYEPMVTLQAAEELTLDNTVSAASAISSTQELKIETPPLEASLSMQPCPTPVQPYDNQFQATQLPLEPPPLPESVPCPAQEVPPLPPTAPAEIPPAPPMRAPCTTSIHDSNLSSLPTEIQSAVSFKRQQSNANQKGRSKDQLSRSKSSPVPKEDANIPLVTPSLLQMVRLRSVNVGDEQAKALAESSKTSGKDSSQDQSQTQAPSQTVPQKPIRKSLSMKSPPPTGTSSSMCLQEAIRMKTAAMSSRDMHPVRISLRSPITYTSGGEPGALYPRSPEGGDLHKSPASTASFIFSRSTKKVVIETPSSPEAQSSLKQNLVAELMQVSDPAKSPNGKPGIDTKRPGKVPPPVAKKPGHGPNHQDRLVSQTTKAPGSRSEPCSSSATGNEVDLDRKEVQPAGQKAQSKEGYPHAACTAVAQFTS